MHAKNTIFKDPKFWGLLGPQLASDKKCPLNLFAWGLLFYAKMPIPKINYIFQWEDPFRHQYFSP